MLIVDDDKDMCRVISDVLKASKLRVTIAYDAASALAKIKKRQYDLMILDYKLNGKTGLNVLEKARQIRPSIRTIMISAYGNESVRARARELGAYDFLDKPFDIDKLVKAVKKALKKKGGQGGHSIRAG